MRPLNPRRLSSVLRSRDAGLKNLLEHGEALNRLTEQVRSHLPLPLSLHCRAGGVRDGRLTLVADTPAWAAKLRFHGPALVQKLNRTGGASLSQVRVIISPPVAEAPRTVRPRPVLSEESARLLADTAAGIDDPELRSALLRLTRRGRPRS